MKRALALVLVFLFAVVCSGPARAEEKVIRMSTTTSTQNSGLLDVLLPEFHKDTGIQVLAVAKGTGAALRDGMEGNVDVVFVHAIEREEEFVANGYATKRYAVMHNDFVILGPAEDPAGIRGMADAAKALEKIAHSKSLFASRGDDSGTHIKEQELWEETDVPIEESEQGVRIRGKYKELEFVHPKGLGEWYLSVGQGMGRTLAFAEEKQAYVLCDRGTYLNFKFGRDAGLDLEVLCEGDPRLHNPYGVLPINPALFPHARYHMARTFAQWLLSPRGQQLIRDYRLMGQPLFIPDALD